MNLEEETITATQMLKNKVVECLWRHREREVMIQFTDGMRLYIDHTSTGLELSITGDINQCHDEAE
jgi:hypothetical protein